MKATIGATVRGGTSIHYRTGDWREARPIFVSRLAPCREACPAGIDIQGFLWEARHHRFDRAWKTILEENPFPSVCGRVCGHPCEGACNRKEFDEPLAVHALERFVGDYGLANDLTVATTTSESETIAIVGSGPAGLSCAYHLRRLGYGVKVFERSSLAGGMLRWGIPGYRLPQIVLDQEIKKLLRIGIKIDTDISLSRDFLVEGLKEFKAIFLALGNQKNRKMGIPGEDYPEVQFGIDFLHRVKAKESFHLGQRVTVVGGGNTAIDVVRTALRLGSKPVLIYRRTREEMPAVAGEVEEAVREGVRVEFLTSPVSISKTDGKSLRVECVRNRLGEPESDGRRASIPIDGSNFFIETDTVFSAVGETIDPDHLFNFLGWTASGILVDDWTTTRSHGIFAGGDVTAGPRTVAHAIGSGKKAAMAIHAYLQGKDYDHLRHFFLGNKGSLSMSQETTPPSLFHRNSQVVRYEDLNPSYFEYRTRERMPQLPIENDRIRSFKEVHLGFTEAMATQEAERCFRCGMCSLCENCYAFCPDSAVSRKDQQEIFEIDYDFCKGCGICANECSSHFIDIITEEK